MRWFEYQYWMTDPVALFLVMLAFFLIERAKWRAVDAVSVAAAFVRETLHRGVPLRLPARAAARAALRRGAPPAGGGGRAAVRDPGRDPRLVTPNQPDAFVAGIVDSMAFRFDHLSTTSPTS